MNEIAELIREFGYPILIVYVFSIVIFLGFFGWVVKKFLDNFKNF